MLSRDQKKLLLIHLVRDPDTARTALDRLTDDLWNGSSEVLEMICWTTARDAFKTNLELPPREFFEAEVRRRAVEYGLCEADDDQLTGAFNLIYCYPSASLSFKACVKLLEEFLVERQTDTSLIKLQDPEASRFEIIEDMWKAVQGSRVSSVQPFDVATAGIDVFTTMERVATGCGPFDELLGGIRMDECIGLLGPMKGGKTSLCISLACCWLKQNKDNKATFISYEEPAAAQWPKFLISYMGKYESSAVAGKPVATLPDEIKADLLAAQAGMANRLSIIDASPSSDIGGGGAAELDSIITQQYKAGKLGQIVIVDHVRPLVSRYLGNKNRDASKHTRFEIQNVCNVFKAVTSKYGVSGVLAHQLDAEGNKNPIKVPSHMNASESKMFPEILNHVVCLGAKGKNDVAWFNLSASRSLANKTIKVKIDGAHCRVTVARNYVLSDKDNDFVSPETAALGRMVMSEFDS